MQTGKNKRGYTSVGKELFYHDTQRMAANRRANLAKKKAKTIRPASAKMPRSYEEGPLGPSIEDHARIEAGHCNGFSYAFPKGYYVPLRNADTKDGKSIAHTIYGERPKRKVPVRYRNERMYLKKHGDMSQNIPLRSTRAREDPDKHMIGSLQVAANLDRYLGSDYYVSLYKRLEDERAAIVHKPDFMDPENPPRDIMDKGVHKSKEYFAPVHKNFPTTYKKEYLEPDGQPVCPDRAG